MNWEQETKIVAEQLAEILRNLTAGVPNDTLPPEEIRQDRLKIAGVQLTDIGANILRRFPTR